ncbi:MAG TPA: SprT-like domain-containing protein [Terriglobia bacterium]|nr:SprT-like domain-containing protein [Terriglobia bacterium]
MNLELIFQTAHREIRPRTPIPEITVEFFPFAGLNHTARLNNSRLVIRLSDIFTDAPTDVYYSLALILLAKLYHKKIDTSYHRTYRTFILTGEIQERARVARNERCRLVRSGSSRGSYVDLEELFNRLNEEYFASSLDKPRLSWSAKKSRYVLGRYDVTHHTIFISRVFDSPKVPRHVVEYVMFHEMLHLKHRSRVQESRLMVHTPEFKADERNFRYYKEAKHWLRSTQ